jgi:hypothetical protein
VELAGTMFRVCARKETLLNIHGSSAFEKSIRHSVNILMPLAATAAEPLMRHARTQNGIYAVPIAANNTF